MSGGWGEATPTALANPPQEPRPLRLAIRRLLKEATAGKKQANVGVWAKVMTPESWTLIICGFELLGS